MIAKFYVCCGLLSVFMVPVLPVAVDAGVATAPAVDHRIYSDLLKKHVKNGQVNYGGFKSDEARLDQYLDILANTDVERLSSSEQFAFYTNAYNAWTIKLILSGYPGVKSIKDFGSLLRTPWQRKIVRINGKVLTLDDIEHNILRPRFKDPRVHFAINCAALSCPPLQSEPFQGDKLDRQLDDATRMFINNPARNYLKGDTLYVSKIFKWFAEDFDHDVLGFVSQYAETPLKRNIDTKKNALKVKYLHYDWSLNGS